MTQRKPVLIGAGIAIIAVLFVSASFLSAHAEQEAAEATAEAAAPAEDVQEESALRADAIVIDAAAALGDQDQPLVVFYHTKHTDALAKMEGKDCSSCHIKKDDGSYSFKYMRVEEYDSYNKLTNLYHDNCAACHTEVKAQYPNVPLAADCKGCHVGAAQAEETALILPYGMTLSLHAKHVQAERERNQIPEEQTCKACHHVYDEATESLVYAEGEEGTCRYCHKDEPLPMQGVVSPTHREASHDSCVNCHVAIQEKYTDKVASGPVDCAACHSEAGQAAVKPLLDVPRLKRGQPDQILLLSGAPDASGIVTVDWAVAGPGPVAFNHKLHELHSETCRVCHHPTPTGGSLEACAKQCHTTMGAEAGNWVTLNTAMHDSEAMASCVGCHNAQLKDPSCAGCHAQIQKESFDDLACDKCHEQEGFPTKGKETLIEQKRIDMAAKVVEGRTSALKYVKDEDVPEKVVINYFDENDEYQASELPHRQIYKKLVEGTGKSGLAKHFHGDALTLCASCHHNAPMTLNPPKCVTCHGQPFQPQSADRPGLKGAFHISCIGCHQQMNVEPKATDCEGCHKKKTD